MLKRFEATGTVAFPPERRSIQAHTDHMMEQFEFFKTMFAKAGVKQQEAK